VLADGLLVNRKLMLISPFSANWAFTRTMAGNGADDIWFIELYFLSWEQLLK